MSDKHFIGLDLTSFESAGQYDPISRVTLYVDEENVYTAGDDTGKEIAATCPSATQDMANALLSALTGYVYRPFDAESANIDPSAELGDGLTVGGIYSVFSKSADNGDGFPTVSAPGEKAVEEEYPMPNKSQQYTDRKTAQTRSLIKKAADEIRLEIEDVSGDVSALSVTIDGVTVTGPSGETRIKGSSIDTTTIGAQSISAEQVNLTGAISFDDLTSDVQDDINDAHSLAESAADDADAANTKISAWSYNGGTYIDGTKIMAGTVMASQLLGGSVSLLTAYEDVAGKMGITGASSADFAVDLTSYGALRLTANSGNVYLASAQNSVMLGYRPNIAYGLHVDGHLVPFEVGTYYCGAAAVPWAGMYTATSPVVTSDKNLKSDIETLPQKYAQMVMDLAPKRFKLIKGSAGRYHVGFVAQDVKEAMDQHGIDSLEFGGWIADKDIDGNDVYMLRYEEFIAILLLEIQNQDARIQRLEELIA